jgi:hypothetical protein
MDVGRRQGVTALVLLGGAPPIQFVLGRQHRSSSLDQRWRRGVG